MSKQTTLIDRLQEQASTQPHKKAFTFLADGETEIDRLTYQQLNEKAKAIAFVLQSHHAQGARALLLFQPGLDFITAFLGCLYAGVIAVPVYPPRANRSLERLLAIVTDAEASFALTTQSIQEQVESKFASHNVTENIRFIATDALKLDLATEWRDPHLTLDQLAFLQYTSGSTGKPKGVMVSHGNLIANSATIQHCFGNQQEHILTSWLPPYHDMGLIGSIIQPIYVGSSMYLMAPVTFLQRPYRWLQAISNYRGQTNGAPNFAYDLCVESVTPEQKATLDLSCWELAFSGAEPVRAETLERFSEYFRDCGFQPQAFYPCYGMAESTLMITGSRRNAQPVATTFDLKQLEENQAVETEPSESAITLVSSGENSPEQKLAIANPETRHQCSDGAIGEIWVKSPSVAQGYWNRPELTAHSFDGTLITLTDTQESGWLRTGDLGFLRQGELFVTGRLKDLIIIRGRNYYPQDLELTVDHAHEAIRAGNVAAFTVEVEGGEQLVITPEIKRTSLRNLNVAAVTKAIRRAIAEHHELQVYAIVLLKTGSIPKTSSGKIQRHACKAGYLDGSLNSVGEFILGASKEPGASKNLVVSEERSELFVPQATNQKQLQIQHWLQQNLAQRLGIPISEIDVQEPFASTGLSSVAAVGLSADLEDWLAIKLSPTVVYDYPNIVELAAYLADDASSQSLSPAQPTVVTADNLAQQLTDIAIIGLGCRFPGANNPAEFWQLLQSGKDAISNSGDRWAGSGWGGFIDGVDQFDPEFFGITPREAQSIDPQQRLLLEVSWSALEDAGIANRELAGSNTGVFIGISSSDYSQLRFHWGTEVDAYLGTGNAHSIAANRLSYLFDLKGPSLAVDTACSSSLVVLHLASQSLKTGECDRAIVGGVNLMLSPELSQTFELAGMMAADGRCKTFDASADGYVRGEGCGVVILKRLEDARRDGDRILAVVKGSAINQDGRSNGLTAPTVLVQNQIDNLPPGTLKSTIVMILACAWIWLWAPRFIFGAASGIGANVTRDSNATRDLIRSAWYRDTFAISWADRDLAPGELPAIEIRDDSDAVSDWATTAGGRRYSRTWGQGFTGLHVDGAFCDDPDDADKVWNETTRVGTQNRWTRAIENRVNNEHRSIRKVMQQIVHVEGMTAYLLSLARWSPRNPKGWARLCIPAEYGMGPADAPEETPWGWRDWRTVVGEPMHARLSPGVLADKRLKLPGYEGQYNQNPDRQVNGIFERRHARFFVWEGTSVDTLRRRPEGCPVNRVEHPPVIVRRAELRDWTLSVDAANSLDPKPGAKVSAVGLIVGACLVEDRFIVDDRTRVLGVDGTYAAIYQALRDWPIERVLVEMKALGAGVVSELERAIRRGWYLDATTDAKIELVGPDGNRVRCEVEQVNPGKEDKIQRAHGMLPSWQQGQIFLLDGAAWLYPQADQDRKVVDEGCVGEVCSFPGSRRKDRVDAISQFVGRYRGSTDALEGMRAMRRLAAIGARR